MKHQLKIVGVIIFLFSFISSHAEKITISSAPNNSKIYINGVLKGTGKVRVSIPKNSCITVSIMLEGYVQVSKEYCDKKGSSKPPRSEFIQLKEDESFTSTIISDAVNNEIRIIVKSTKTREEAWKQVVSTILGKFDVIESNDERAGYLRTSWEGVPFENNTIRTRIIVKEASDEPLVYKVKIASEESGKSGTPFSADEQFKAFHRMLKRYDGLIEELITRLKN